MKRSCRCCGELFRPEIACAENEKAFFCLKVEKRIKGRVEPYYISKKILLGGYMISTEVTSLSSKGQIVIPDRIRKQMGLSSGSKLIVITDGTNLLLKPIEEPKMESFKKLIDESRKFAEKGKNQKK